MAVQLMGSLCVEDTGDLDKRLKLLFDIIEEQMYENYSFNAANVKVVTITSLEGNQAIFHRAIFDYIPKIEPLLIGYEKKLQQGGLRPDIFFINKRSGVAVVMEIKFEKTAQIAHKQAIKYLQDVYDSYNKEFLKENPKESAVFLSDSTDLTKDQLIKNKVRTFTKNKNTI